MSNSAFRGRERFADPDDRAERAGQEEQRRQRNEVGKRRVDVVAAAEQVVPHLVRAENAEQRAAVPEALQQQRPVERRPAAAENSRQNEA